MARPKLTVENLRTRRVSVFFSPAELRILRWWAEAAQMSFPDYLRQRALHPPEPSQEPRRLATAEFRELSRIGVNLNQIAKSMNRGRPAPAGTRAALERVRDLIRYLMPEAED